jgi:8-oxo-dGTP pyrophosphatase MutT (NUDIX family)
MADQKKEEKTKAVKRYSSGGAIFKIEKGKVFWLLIKKKGKKIWQLPKGGVEVKENKNQAALREVWEETGQRTKILAKIGGYNYSYAWGNVKVTDFARFYLMLTLPGKTGKIDRKEIKEIIYADFKDALKLLYFENDKKILRRAAELLKSFRNLV